MKRIYIGALLAVVLAGCAKETTTDADVYEQRALDAWVAKYAPDAVKMDNGGYYEVLTAPAPDAAKIEAGKWIVFSYIVKDLEGNVILTRSEAIARQMGTFTRYTHYTPDFTQLAEKDNTSMIEGQYLNLLDMRIGEVRRLYLPSRLGYGSATLTNSAGYGGQYALSGEKPFIVDSLKVLEVIADPQQRDYDQVDAEAQRWSIALADSVKLHLYMEKLFTLGAAGDTVKADSTALIYYVGRFLDGFVFDTNIDSIRRRVYGEVRVTADTAAIVFKKATATALPASIFVPVCGEFIYGDTIQMVISSAYAYGATGRTGSETGTTSSGGVTTLLRTEIQPYTPLIYKFVVLPK